ncbi:MAG: hypothetical protein KC944_13255 [Candidatus Omnitrophica bacterium]|nr:hypothetical protein [Candidatus Omnitrophota bacterium]
MNKIDSNEPHPDRIIQDLHKIREGIVDSYNGDLHLLTEDARKRQAASGVKVWPLPECGSSDDLEGH